jgi:DNA replication protein DnaC
MSRPELTGMVAEIRTFCREMKLPTVARECEPQAEQLRRASGDPLVLLHGLLGGTGTGKTHLASAIGDQACARGHAVRFTTAAALVNELVEAADARALSRVVARFARFDLLILDELGYLPLSAQASQPLFQVVAERGERKATIVTTNLPFSEWTTIIPDRCLCRAFVERITYRAHILETGVQSVRLEEMLKLSARKQRKKAAPAP